MDDTAQRSLLLWAQSFHEKLATDVQVSSMEDLCDGVFLSKIMHHIDSEYVNLEQINEQPGGNWALKSNNLKTLLRAVEQFYTDELGQICRADELVDPLLIAKENDVHEVSKLTELLLGCAVQCPNKSEYIHPIMQMGASEQASLMHAIENLMHRFHPTSPGGASSQSRRNSIAHGASFDEMVPPSSSASVAALVSGSSAEALAAQLAQALERSSSMELRYLDMEREKRELTERFERTLTDHRELADKYTALESERDQLRSERQNTLTRDNKKIQQIVDNEVHALQMQMEEKDLELNRVKRESGERLMMLENEVRRQADELDISRSKLGTLNKLEASVTKYKKKLEEMNSLRAQVRELENLNAQYLDKVVDLESTIKTMPGLKSLVEKYKNQVVELETANVQASSNLNVKEQKIRRLQEELDSALGGKEFLESQVEELRTQLSSMQYRESNDDAMAAGESSAVNGGGLSADMLLGRDSVSGLRERVARLERENVELKSGNADAGQAELENDLDMAVKAKESLQVSLFQMQKQTDQLSEDLRNARIQIEQQQQVLVQLQQAHTQPQQQLQSQQQWQNAPDGPEPMQVSNDMAVSEGAAAAGTAGFATSAALESGVAMGPGGVMQAPVPTPGSVVVTSSNNALSSAQIAEYQDKLEKLEIEAEAVDSLRATVTELTKRLKEKESVINELSEQRSKLENYTKKTLHAVQTKYMVAVSSHRNQINEKQERVDFLEKKMKEVRASYSREQALMMSSFYEIGTEMQRRTMMPQGPAAGAPGAGSWLANKRTEERAKRRQGA
ncbi:Protein Hook 1 [Phytophthora pseudosyringae]|uniref:Protein Hook 1 n=1 Tax=Phytophthora pseudosyringae TaxID=221518 RepID=A0A8T1VLH3_9STRA|nr:Protein Hook 1 [Phytophthora pseudosyringae]